MSSQIKYLNLELCPLSDDALTALAEFCPNLEELWLKNVARISDSGVAEVAKSCKKLRKLNVEACREVSDIALKALIANNAGTLEELNLMELGRNKITVETLTDLKKSFPEIELILSEKKKLELKKYESSLTVTTKAE